MADSIKTLQRPKGASKKSSSGDPAAQVYQHISDAILEQRLLPGTRLGEEALCEIFSVSRPIIRRVLTKLAHDRLVEIRPHRGATIASPSLEEARQVFEARRIIERAIVTACCAGMVKADLAELRDHVRMETECAQNNDRVRWIRLSGEFHLVLARAAGNMVLHDILKDLIAQTSLIIGLYGNGSRSICSDGEHERIVEQIAKGDEAGAVETMLRHVHDCEGALHIEEDGREQTLWDIFAAVRPSDPPAAKGRRERRKLRG